MPSEESGGRCRTVRTSWISPKGDCQARGSQRCRGGTLSQPCSYVNPCSLSGLAADHLNRSVILSAAVFHASEASPTLRLGREPNCTGVNFWQSTLEVYPFPVNAGAGSQTKRRAGVVCCLWLPPGDPAKGLNRRRQHQRGYNKHQYHKEVEFPSREDQTRCQ
jgi:hypothetical protein